MIFRVPLGIAFAIVVLFSAHESRAQCPFPHPARAPKFRAEFVQVFVPCVPYVTSCCNQPNDTTESNVPSCNPAATYAENSSSQSESWIWGPNSRGSISISASKGDVRVAAQLSGIWDAGGPVTGNGTLSMVVRATIYDGGPMTVIDFPLSFPFPVVNGKGKIKTTFLEQPVLASATVTGPCTSLEIVVPGYVQDVNHTLFATTGVFLQ